MASTRTELLDFKIRAYRTKNPVDEKFQNYRAAMTVQLDLVVEIDGIEIPLVSHAIPLAAWERTVKNYGKEKE